ncbi:hypothetical protein RKD19_003280 [Streptomyces canus]
MRSKIQYRTSPIWDSHINSGRMSRSSSGTFVFVAPRNTSRCTAIASTRACSDSGEKGLSGLSGSAAFLKNCTANS